MVEAQQISSGQLVAASLLATRAVGAFMSIQPMMMRFQELQQAMGELGQLLDLDAKLDRPPERRRIVTPPPMNIERLDYLYPGGELPTLTNISFTVEPGQLVVVVGKVGCGKSTLLRLLAGHFVPSGGIVTVGDLTINSPSHAAELGREVAYLEQSPVLLHGTVEEYLLGEHATTEAKDAALATLRELHVDEGLRGCGLALNTQIAFAGSNLSGGQRRMLAVARAFSMNRLLLVMDEPTAGLDSEAERTVLEAIRKMKGRVTMVVASHSADIVGIADRVLVLDRGHQAGWGAPK